jgi:endonuclease-3 related protein
MEAKPGVVLRDIYARMFSELGPQDWWPARSRLEIILGAILVQNTAWQNAALGVKQLRARGLLRLDHLQKASLAEIENCVRPAGFYRQKARTITNFLDWLERDCQGSLTRMFGLAPHQARLQLLEIKGLGPETVDAILLYAGGHPFFVADGYTRRILARHQLVQPEARYEDVQKFLHRHLAPEPKLFNEYHALLVEVGKQHCKLRAPQCPLCPLEALLGQDQPVKLTQSRQSAR